jgi:methionine-rich copper-binding protein CopC
MARHIGRAIPFLLTALAALAPGVSLAHAIIIKSQPAVDATVGGASVPIALRFNSRIDQQLSRVTLFGPDGKSAILPLAPSTSPDLLTTKASGLAPGAYRLHWQVLSVDGHITRGDIPFNVSE